MTECNGCGGCCDPVTLPVTYLELQTNNIRRLGMTIDDEDLVWARAHLRPMSPREGLLKRPDLRGRRLAVSAQGEPAMVFFYSCDLYDTEARRCTDYEHRPPLCRGFPWYDDKPNKDAALPPECSFRADIGQPVVLGPTRP